MSFVTVSSVKNRFSIARFSLSIPSQNRPSSHSEIIPFLTELKYQILMIASCNHQSLVVSILHGTTNSTEIVHLPSSLPHARCLRSSTLNCCDSNLPDSCKRHHERLLTTEDENGSVKSMTGFEVELELVPLSLSRRLTSSANGTTDCAPPLSSVARKAGSFNNKAGEPVMFNRVKVKSDASYSSALCWH